MYSRNIHVGRRKLLQLIGKQEFSFLNHDDDYQFPELINSNFAKKMNTFERLQKYGIEADGSNGLTISNIREHLFTNEFIFNSNETALPKLALRNRLITRDQPSTLRVIIICMSLPLNHLDQK